MGEEAPRSGWPLGLAIASALLLIAAFPPYGLWPLAWPATALLLWSLRGSSPRRGLWLGLAAGFCFDFLGGWWRFPAGVNAGAYLCIVGVCAASFGLFGAGAAWLWRRAPGLAPLALPSLWGALEWLRANLGFLAIPWDVLGYCQWTVPGVAGIAAVAGVWGVSFVMVGAAVLVTETLGSVVEVRRPAPGGPARLALAAALLVLLVAGVLEARRLAAPAPTFRVAVVQAGRYLPGHDAQARAMRVLGRYQALTREAAREKPALIVWPESSVPAPLPSDRAATRAVAALAREIQTYLLVSSSGRDKASRSGTVAWANSAYLFSPAGEIVARYDKIRLLPFNEYVPLRGWVPWPRWIAADMRDAEPGAAHTVFDVGGARFGVLICWENLFGTDFRRALAASDVDFMVSLTNEAFTQVATGRRQLFAINAMRAVENGVAVVRAATTGVSAFVGRDGRVEAVVADAAGRELDSEGFRVHEVPLAGSPTPYRRFGDWIVVAEVAMLLAAAFGGRSGSAT